MKTLTHRRKGKKDGDSLFATTGCIVRFIPYEKGGVKSVKLTHHHGGTAAGRVCCASIFCPNETADVAHNALMLAQ